MTNKQQQPDLEQQPLDDLVKQVIQANQVDVPVMATRIIGNHLELYLYGGQVIRVAIDAAGASNPPPNKPKPTRTRRGGSQT